MTFTAMSKEHNTIIPFLIMDDAQQAISFYKKIFNAELISQMPLPEGGIAHAEIAIGNTPLVVADACPQEGHHSPHKIGGSPVNLILYVKDVDSVFSRALTLGAKLVRPIHTQFYGDRAGTFEDPFGHIWTVANQKKDVKKESIEQRMANLMTKEQDA
ncbi:VOC family protein [Pseudoalteromonas carrageenovora]|uniref:VOC family protein n=1 Tax=Pseudoalteromonas carrageenovora TaxID=227 RepID=UPI0031201BB5